MVCIVIGAALITGSIVMYAGNEEESNKAGERAAEIIEEIKEEEEKITEEEETIRIDGNEYIGYIRIESIGIELPVMESEEEEKLEISPILQSGRIEDDNAVIAGHNYTRHFGRLNRVKEGDRVKFTKINGETIEYIIEEKKITEPEETAEIFHSGYDLVMYTCTLTGNQRIVICCNRAE